MVAHNLCAPRNSAGLEPSLPSASQRASRGGWEDAYEFYAAALGESGINWVEALPRVLRVYHDTRGKSGYSPFQIVFGQDRFVAGATLPIERECVGASDFMHRMEWLERGVSKNLIDQLESEVNRANSSRRVPPTYQPGDWVWVFRPKTGESSAKV